jgi:hypothetical protein
MAMPCDVFKLVVDLNHVATILGLNLGHPTRKLGLYLCNFAFKLCINLGDTM